MGSTKVARVWFAVTALVVLIGLVIAVLLAFGDEQGFFTTGPARVFNVFCFFTIQSNIIVGVTSLLLVANPNRSSQFFGALRLTGLSAIVVTGVLYHLLLADLVDLSGWGMVQTQLLHTAAPILYVAGWLVFGPRGRTSPRLIGLSAIFPMLWVIFTLIRGPIVDWYPYPFIDVIEHSYGRVLLNIIGVAVGYVALGFAAHALDRFLTRRTTQSAALADA